MTNYDQRLALVTAIIGALEIARVLKHRSVINRLSDASYHAAFRLGRCVVEGDATE